MSNAMTYDDVLLVPSYNHWDSRRIVDISVTDKSGKLTLELPVMTANMDTVTENEMADFIAPKGALRHGAAYFELTKHTAKPKVG